MPAPQITIDLYRLLPLQQDERVAESVADYVSVCIRLREAMSTSKRRELKVHVYNRVVAVWIESFAQTFGERIKIRRYGARDALSGRVQMALPDTVHDEQIFQSGLLEVEIEPQPGRSFEDVLLEHFYHHALTYTAFPLDQFLRLITDYDNTRWLDNEQRALVANAYRDRLTHWIKREMNEGRRWLIEQFRDDPENLRTCVGSFQALQNYPPRLGEKVLGKAVWRAIQQSGLNPNWTRLDEAALTETCTEIEYFLGQAISNTTEASELKEILGWMSGYLLVEFNAIEKPLRQHLDWLTPALMRQIEQRFVPIRAGITTRLVKLRQLIQPPYPTAPNLQWETDHWLTWVRDVYMPYHTWLENQHREDAQVATYAEQFADWYYAHYLTLRNSVQEHFAFAALYLNWKKYNQADTVSLIILLDNFNYSHFADLQQLLYQQGFSLVGERPVLSLIPTATEVGKAALIASKGEQVDLPDTNYRDLAIQSWQSALAPGRSVLYLEAIGELQRLDECPYGLLILNYLPVDKALHESANTTGREHADSVHGLLETLAASISEFAHRFQLEKRLQVHLVSDHGSTRIGMDVVNVVDQRFFRDKAEMKHHRYLALSDQQFASLPQMAGEQCYLIDRRIFKTNQNYLAARSYYRFASTDEDFYVHGGLTPEEVVVPLAHFELKPIQVAAPTLHLITTEFRYTVRSSVKLEIGNPNPYSLGNVRLKLGAGEDLVIETLNPKQIVEGALTTVFRKEPGRDNKRELTVWVYYECQGRSFGPTEQRFAVTLKSMMETRDDFDL